MSASVLAISEGLKTRLATISGVRAFSYQPPQLNPPMAYPVLNSATYHQTMGMGGSVTSFDFTIFVIVGRWIDRTAHASLDGFLSPTGSSSIMAALEGDKTLGGACSDLMVASSANISALEQDDAEFLQVSFSVTVVAQ